MGLGALVRALTSGASITRRPDPFGIQYRVLAVDAVTHVVRARLGKASAISYVHGFAESQVPLKDQPSFMEVVETQLINLHEGNIARYRVRSGEVEGCRLGWG